MTVKAIDVSVHQGRIDWGKVKAAGIEAAFIRAGYGKYKKQKDTQFDANVKGASEEGIPIGVYWYSYAKNAKEAAEEAKVCLETIAPYRDKIVLPVFFDQEYEPGILSAGKDVRTECCRVFLETVQKAGYQAGIYCSFDWIQNKIGAVEGVKWIAQYGARCSYSGADLYMWQYSSKGSVAGIKGNVDLDHGYFSLGEKSPGWKKEDGGWVYYENGVRVRGAWRKVKGNWYYFNENGKMATGRVTIKGKRYYLNESAYEGTPEGALWITDPDGAKT